MTRGYLESVETPQFVLHGNSLQFWSNDTYTGDYNFKEWYVDIFKDGKWAEIVETTPEYTMEEAIEKMGHEFKIKK